MAKCAHNQRLTPFTRGVILTAFYFIGGLVGKETVFLSGNVTLVWPPAGIALAAILLFGYRFWPGVALGAVLFTFMNGTPFGFFTLGTAIGNTIGAIVCAYLLKKFTAFDNAMERTRDVTGYIGLACFLGTTVNAAFNVVSLAYGGVVKWDDLFSTTLVWWVPNALAGLVVAPLIITWATPSATRWTATLIIEAVICSVGLVGGTLISFNTWFVYGIQNYPLAYLPFPFLVWSSLRFGPRGASAGTLLVSALAIYSLARGTGPFVAQAQRDSLMLIGSYIGILAVTNMLLAAAATERRVAERAVSENEKRFRAVVQDQTDLICRFTGDAVLTFVNDAFCRFRDQSSAQLIGTNFFQNLAPNDAAVVQGHIDSLTVDEPVISFDQRLHSPDGRVVWHQYRIRRLQEKGATPEFQAVIQDITQRHLDEEAIRQSKDAAESANRAKSQFLASMSHELRTPLNAIIGFSDILTDKTFGELNERQLKYGKNISNSGRHLLQLINDILDLAKVEAGRAELACETFDVAKALSEVRSIVKTLANKKSINLEFSIDENLVPLFADEKKFKQIMFNLLSNAIKFTPDGGNVSVTAALQSLKGADSKPVAQFLRVAVADTGIGIKPQDQERIFREFEQVDSSHGRQQQGTGLGLALTQKFVEMHGGRIWVTSEGVGGKGSTFIFTIPIAKTEADSAPSAEDLHLLDTVINTAVPEKIGANA